MILLEGLTIERYCHTSVKIFCGAILDMLIQILGQDRISWGVSWK